MSACFFLCGRFIHEYETTSIYFSKQKTLRLLIPYIIWGVLAWIFWFWGTSRYGSSIESDISWWEALLGLLYGRRSELLQNGPLWFLCCIISLEWIYYFVSRIPTQWVRWIVIFCLAEVGCGVAYIGKNWIWGISATLIILPIYAIGAEYSWYIKEKMSSLRGINLILIFIISLAGLWIGYTYNNEISLCDSIIGNPCFYYISVISAIGFWLSIALVIEKTHDPYLHFITGIIGLNTLFILCTHMMTFSLIKGIAVLCLVPLHFLKPQLVALCYGSGRSLFFCLWHI